jgi:hypothetical protein
LVLTRKTFEQHNLFEACYDEPIRTARSRVPFAVVVAFFVFLALADSRTFSAIRTSVVVGLVVYAAVRALDATATPNALSADERVAQAVARKVSEDDDLGIQWETCPNCGSELPRKKERDVRRR